MTSRKSRAQTAHPAVPVIRDDEDQLLAVPYQVAMITAPAVNAGAVRANEPHNVPHLCETETFTHALDVVVFAVLDNTPGEPAVRAFADRSLHR